MSENSRDPFDTNRIWEVLGEHKGKISGLEGRQYQVEQAVVNVRAESLGNLEKIENRINNFLDEIKRDIIKPLLDRAEKTDARVGRIEKFLYIFLGGAATLFSFVKYIDEIKHFFSVLIN